jgi:hypothetical protein
MENQKQGTYDNVWKEWKIRSKVLMIMHGKKVKTRIYDQ